MTNTSEQMNLSGTSCKSCGGEVVRDSRAVVFLDVAWHRACWLAIVQPPRPTSLERRAGRNWGSSRCRLSA